MLTDEALTQIARQIASEADGFTGGPVELFGEVGRNTLGALQSAGLKPHNTLLDVGCGVLRLGYWLINYLDADKYCGVEPSPVYVQLGLKYLIDADTQAKKRPRFDDNQNFDFSPFGVKFDYVVARSIFSHASPKLINNALDAFRDNSSENGVMLASFKPTTKADGDAEHIDVKNKGDWSWRRYSPPYLIGLAQAKGLHAEKFLKPFNGQRWLRVSKKPA